MKDILLRMKLLEVKDILLLGSQNFSKAAGGFDAERCYFESRLNHLDGA